MDTISVNQFRNNLKSYLEQVFRKNKPLKVNLRSGGAFVVQSSDDWEREQETLFVLQNRDLMQQIGASIETNNRAQGYKPSKTGA